MAHKTCKPRRPRCTPEQVAAAKERDRNLRAQAAADMASPDAIRRRVAQLLTGGMPRRLLRYSLRNQLLILRQAEQRGITLADIDTKAGWVRRGRLIAKGQAGLRIVQPVGATDDDTTDDDTNETTDPAQHEQRPRFRMAPRWDISQTAPMDSDAADEGGDCPGCDAEPGEPCRTGCTCLGCTGQTCAEDQDNVEPAEVLWNKLTDQLTKAGYRLIWPAADADLSGHRVRADHDARIVHADVTATADPAALADLAVILGEVITRAGNERAEARALAAAH